jgi:V-type H+-transporting ATPase subunit a
MNKMSFDGDRKALIGEGWCPQTGFYLLQQALRSASERTAATIPPLINEIPSTKMPPTSQKNQ